MKGHNSPWTSLLGVYPYIDIQNFVCYIINNNVTF